MRRATRPPRLISSHRYFSGKFLCLYTRGGGQLHDQLMDYKCVFPLKLKAFIQEFKLCYFRFVIVTYIVKLKTLVQPYLEDFRCLSISCVSAPVFCYMRKAGPVHHHLLFLPKNFFSKYDTGDFQYFPGIYYSNSFQGMTW